MDERLVAVIRDSLRQVGERRLLDAAEIEVEARGGVDKGNAIGTDLVLTISRDPAPITPWFVIDDEGQLASPQAGLFGFYALRNVLRMQLVGVRFFTAGKVLLRQNYLAAAVSMFYSAAFQLLHSYLSLNGRVAIQPVLGRPRVVIEDGAVWGEYGEVSGQPELLVGVLTRSGRWIFEKARRSHAAQWRQLKALTSFRQPPLFFIDFFRYLCTYREELIVEEEDLVDEGLKRVREGRHDSLYGGRGFDPTAWDLMEDGIGGGGMNLKAEAYETFVRELLLHSAAETESLTNAIQDETGPALTALRASIFNPMFEMEWTSIPNDDELNVKLGAALTWLFKNWNFRQG